MKIIYDHETDSMYINLSEQKSVDSDEVADGIVLDFNGMGDVVGIDIQHASAIANIHQFSFEQANHEKVAA